MVAIRMAPVLLRERIREQAWEERKTLRQQMRRLRWQMQQLQDRVSRYDRRQTVLLVILTVLVLAFLGK
jgi:hypothetical protein